jgi:hypothetical protein
MKKHLKLLFAAVAAICCTACPTYNYDHYEPQYMSRQDLLVSVKSLGAKELSDIGKLWINGSNIYICERYKGVHIIDNTNPSAPVAVDFIQIPGCLDIAVRGDILYADNATDLIAYNLTTKQVAARHGNAFRTIVSPDGTYFTQPRKDDMVIVGFKRIEETEHTFF